MRPTSSSPRLRSGALLTAAALALATLPALLFAAPAHAAGTSLITEQFSGASVTDPAWDALGDACLTGADAAPPAGSSELGPCASSVEAPTAGDRPGFLQLTDTRNYRVGGVLYNKALPGNGGVVVQFDQWQYGGNGADGIGFFLTDGSVDLTSAGGNGGSLGYAPINLTPGVDGGYLGLGLDAYGNYTNPTERRDAGCDADETGPGFVPNAVSLRGPGDGTTGYCWLAGSVDGTRSTLPGSLRGAGATAADARSVQITVSPDTLPLVTVKIDFHDGTGWQTVFEHQMEDAAPATYKLGFLASTGGLTDTHLIRNLEVSSVAELGQLNVVKQVDTSTPQPARYEVGDTIPYSFLVSNTSQFAPLSDVALVDPGADEVSCPSDRLGVVGSPDASMTCTGSHVVTAEDATSDTYTNTAHATGLDADTVVRSTDASASAALVRQVAALDVTDDATLDDANGNGVADPGETITYEYVVTNTGTETLADVDVQATVPTSVTGGPVPSLAPGATATLTGTYTVTQRDVDDGRLLDDRVVASGTGPGGAVQSAPATASTPLLPATSALATAVTADLADTDGDGLAGVGETITYTYTVRNTGTTTLTDVTLEPGTGTLADPSVGTLAPGATGTRTGTHVVTQADVDAATPVVESLAATGTSPSGAAVRAPSAAVSTPTVTATEALDVVATPVLDDTDGNGVADAGEVVRYTWTVTNRGTTTLTGVTLTGATGVDPASVPTLAPGEQATFSGAPHTVTQAEVDAQRPVTTSVTATATAPDATAVTSPVASTSTPVRAASVALDLATVATPRDADADGRVGPGAVVDVVFTVTNRGTVTLGSVRVDADGVDGLAPSTAPLAPGASVEIRGTRTVTEADVVAGGPLVVSGTATGTATAATPGTPSATSAPASDRVPVVAVATSLVTTITPALQDANGNGLADPGELITWTITVRNTGNVTVRDPRVSTDRSGVLSAPVDTLAPGASTTVTTPAYTVTDADVAAGSSVDTTAVATATAPGGATVTAAPVTAVTATPAAVDDLEVRVVAVLDDTNGDGTADVGERITYRYTVTNGGTTGLRDVTLDTTVSPTADGFDLAAGESVVVESVPYTVTAADVAAGSVTVTVTATGTLADGTTVTSDQDSATTPTTAATPGTPGGDPSGPSSPTPGAPTPGGPTPPAGDGGAGGGTGDGATGADGGPGGALAFTGTDPWPYLAASALLLALGFGTTAVLRRRHRS